MKMGKKFKGKIRDNPLVALEKGNREVMLSLWQEYLAEVIGGAPSADRHRVLTERIEAAADFPRLYADWNDLEVPERARRWMALVSATKEELERCREECIRCGECCEGGSPTLAVEDLRLFQENILDWTDVYTLRRGEKVTSPRDQEVKVLEEERLKIREHPGTATCLFYATGPNRCLIYEHRPEQCRLQLCWREAEEEEPPAPSISYMSRRDLFGGHPEIWEMLAAHEDKCGMEALTTVVQEMAAGEESAADRLFEMLHFDHYLRQMFIQDWEIHPAAVDLLLGRPLSQLLPHFGIKAEMSPEGVFKLEPWVK